MQLTYSEQSSKGGSQRILAVLCACLLGGSTFAAGCSAFGLQWNPAGAFSGAPLQGLLSVCNSIADRLGTTDYIILRKFAGGAAADGSYLPQGIFLTIALLLLCVLSYLILRSGCKWLLLVFALPGAVSFAAAIVFLLAYVLYAEVMRENAYLSRTVEVQENQKVIDTGLYGIVRHPMYMSTLLLFLAMPLVLGSVISFAIMLAYIPIISKRIRNEEQVLEKGLEGYREYKQRVRYKVIPFVW